MLEDDEKGIVRYIHLLLTDYQYNDFLNKRITLRSLLENNEGFFIVDRKYNGEVTANIAFANDIPSQFLPLQDSYCPDYVTDPSLEYAISLKGNKADLHMANPEDLNNVNQHICSFIKSATAFLGDLHLNRQVYVQALAAGSFRINFKIEIDQQPNLFPVAIDNIKHFLNSYFGYVLEKLPKEADDIFKVEKVNSEQFLILESTFHQLYEQAVATPLAGVEQKLIDSMNYSIQNLKEIDYGKSFERLEFINYTTEGGENTIAVIDEKYVASVSDKFHKIETDEDRIEYDQEPKEYIIQVYALNKETGNGGAYLQYDERMSKISLHLRGRDNYQNTVFTHNLDEPDAKSITIKGTAKRVNDIIKEITFTYTK